MNVLLLQRQQYDDDDDDDDVLFPGKPDLCSDHETQKIDLVSFLCLITNQV